MTSSIRNVSLVSVVTLALSACGGGGGGSPVTDGSDMTPGDPPSSEVALANVIDLVANDSRRDETGQGIGGRWERTHGISGPQAVIRQAYRDGGYVNATVSHDEGGQLQHNVVIFQNQSLQGADPWARPGRYINTYEAAEELHGVTRSTRPITDHGLGSDWQVTELSADYDHAGALDIYVVTDARPSDGSLDPFETGVEGDRIIELSGAPAVPADQDFLVVWIDDGDSIEGSLGGDMGSFSCDNDAGCVFVTIDTRRESYTRSTGVAFTPNGGTAQPVARRENGATPNADYLAFGHWLYVPEDVTDADAYDFGVFASGGDPFETVNLRALTGTATYKGDAVGMYYVNGLSSSPDTGSFTADVELTADFGDSREAGFIGGEVNNFEFESDVASSLPTTVTLASRTYDYLPEGFGVPQGSTNIFDTSWRGDAIWPGGHVGGATEANVAGEDWYGQWYGVFYGNGALPTDHPTSVAGVFGTSMWNDYNRSGNGLTGSFGAHRQQQ